MDTKREKRKKWKAFLNQINILAEPFDFVVEFIDRDTVWVTFNETDHYKMHSYVLQMDTPELPAFLTALRSLLANFNSDEEAIFMYQRLNKTNKTLLETIQAEAGQRKALYQFIACLATVEK